MDAELYLEPILNDEIVKNRLKSAGIDPEELFSFLRSRWDILISDSTSRGWNCITKEEWKFLPGIEIIHSRQVELGNSMRFDLDWQGDEN